MVPLPPVARGVAGVPAAVPAVMVVEKVLPVVAGLVAVLLPVLRISSRFCCQSWRTWPQSRVGSLAGTVFAVEPIVRGRHAAGPASGREAGSAGLRRGPASVPVGFRCGYRARRRSRHRRREPAAGNCPVARDAGSAADVRAGRRQLGRPAGLPDVPPAGSWAGRLPPDGQLGRAVSDVRPAAAWELGRSAADVRAARRQLRRPAPTFGARRKGAAGRFRTFGDCRRMPSAGGSALRGSRRRAG